MPFDNHEEAIRFWFDRVNFEQRSPDRNDLKLDRMRELLRRLDDPQSRFPIVHLAGSKGKGSTASFLSTIIQRAGYRTGLFTSPHLVDVAERIQVNRQPISADETTGLLDQVRDAIEQDPLLDVTFFEIGTALGFLHFAQQKVDLAVVEVGLGGRFDSTNVCEPILSVITSISYDHQRILGSTLDRIAREKAGIIKEGVPVISGVQCPEASPVIEEVSRQRGSRLLCLHRDFDYQYRSASVDALTWQPSRVDLQVGEVRYSDCELGLLGEHQAANASVAVACVEEMRRQGWSISEEAIREGLASTFWPARMEVTSRAPLVILDCAHNVASAQALIETLNSFPMLNQGRRFLIFAASHDKDLRGMLQVLAPHFTDILLTSHPLHPRLIAPEEVAKILSEVCAKPITICQSSSQAWHRAHRQAKEEDLICVTGSVFLAGELRPILLESATK